VEGVGGWERRERQTRATTAPRNHGREVSIRDTDRPAHFLKEYLRVVFLFHFLLSITRYTRVSALPTHRARTGEPHALFFFFVCAPQNSVHSVCRRTRHVTRETTACYVKKKKEKTEREGSITPQEKGSCGTHTTTYGPQASGHPTRNCDPLFPSRESQTPPNHRKERNHCHHTQKKEKNEKQQMHETQSAAIYSTQQLKKQQSSMKRALWLEGEGGGRGGGSIAEPRERESSSSKQATTTCRV
jgi:hypothetical protein